MLIGFTGAQSTGKSTLLQMCKSTPYFETNNWLFVDEVTRKVQRDGNMINEFGDNTTQLFILSEHLNNHIIQPQSNMVLDRCVLDGYVYTKWLADQGSVDGWVVRYAENLMHHLADRLDYIFYTQPEDVSLVNDGVRSTNVKFRSDVISIYEELFEHDYAWMKRLIRLRGDINTRMQTILNNIYEKEQPRQQQNI